MKKITNSLLAGALLLALAACSGPDKPAAAPGEAAAPSPPASTPPAAAPPATPPSGAGGVAPTGVPADAQPAQTPPAAAPEPAASVPAPPAPVAAPTVAASAYGGAGATAGGKAAAASAQDSRKALSWYYMKKPKGQVPGFPAETKQFGPERKALWVGSGKKVYLTIDTGGDLGDTKLLVKSLKDNNAKANFFIAGYNVKKDPDYIRQLVADGHLVANHTMTHTDMNSQTDEQIRKEILDYEKLYTEVTGQAIQPYFRFPYGKYNMHILKLVSDMGYTSVFWSTAMVDWEPRKNGPDDPYNDIMGNLHDGNIILMHQGSPENLQALDRIIKGVRQAGYEFALLSDM